MAHYHSQGPTAGARSRHLPLRSAGPLYHLKVREASIKKSVVGADLSKSDVERIAALALEGLEDPDGPTKLPFSVEDGETEVRASSMDELLDELGNPSTLSNLRIFAWHGGRQVFIRLTGNHAYLDLTSQELTWAYGRTAELVNVLKKNRTKVRVVANYYYASFFLACIVILVLIGTLTGPVGKNAASWIAIASATPFVGAGVLLGIFWMRFKRVAVTVTKARPKIDAITILVLVFTVIGAVAAVAQVIIIL